MAETPYEILGNGRIVYRVFDNGKELRIITPEPLPENKVESREIRIPYRRVWIAHDPDYHGESVDGFELIAEISCYEDICSYVFIGSTITFFWTPQPIELYHSYVGNGGVPYGFAATKDYVYGFTHTHMSEGQVIAVSRKRIELRLGKSLSDDLVPMNLYDITYEIRRVPYTTVKQETFRAPFDQRLIQLIMLNISRPERRANYANTVLGLGSRIPRDLAREIATFRTGLRSYMNKPKHNRSNTNAVLGPLPNDFHGIQNVPTVSTRCTAGRCTIMGGARRTLKRRTYKRKTHCRTLRR